MLVIGDGLFDLLAAVLVEAACMDLGFAWFSEDRIRAELGSRRLQPLRMREGGERWVQLYLSWPIGTSPAPAPVAWLKSFA